MHCVETAFFLSTLLQSASPNRKQTNKQTNVSVCMFPLPYIHIYIYSFLRHTPLYFKYTYVYIYYYLASYTYDQRAPPILFLYIYMNDMKIIHFWMSHAFQTSHMKQKKKQLKVSPKLFLCLSHSCVDFFLNAWWLSMLFRFLLFFFRRRTNDWYRSKLLMYIFLLKPFFHRFRPCFIISLCFGMIDKTKTVVCFAFFYCLFVCVFLLSVRSRISHNCDAQLVQILYFHSMCVRFFACRAC